MKKKKKVNKAQRAQRRTKTTAVAIVFLLLGSALVAGVASTTSEKVAPTTQTPVPAQQKDLASSVIGLKEKVAVERVTSAGYEVKIIRSGDSPDGEKPKANRITLYVAGDTVLMAANA